METNGKKALHHSGGTKSNTEMSVQTSGRTVSASASAVGVDVDLSLPSAATGIQTGGSENGGVADSFRGLPMRELISAPLIAVCESQQQLAMTALNFYKKIAYNDDETTTRLLTFDLERPVQTPGGVSTSKIKVQAPFIGLVPVPSLLIERVDVDFQMEVSDSSVSKSEDKAELSSSVSAKWFCASVQVQGKVSTSRENTRTTNQTAKYQVHVTAAQQPQTEGLSKLMDIMASCIEPVPAGS